MQGPPGTYRIFWNGNNDAGQQGKYLLPKEHNMPASLLTEYAIIVQREQREKRIKEELIPTFDDVPGVIQVNMIKALWERPYIGAMIVFENQEALENWWNSLPDEEKEEQKKAVEQYKEIAIIHQDFSIIPNER